MSEHVFTFPAPRLASFMVACARFRESQADSNQGGKVRVFRSASGKTDSGSEAAMAGNILSYYQSLWPGRRQSDLSIIEVPAPLGEAMAFDGAVAISDKIMATRSPVSGSPSNLLEFVMAHEVAHEWWGYRVVPARSPGRAFLMESVAQFAAYKYLDHRGILKQNDAAENELRRYRRAQGSIRNEVPVTRAEAVDELAYNKGPYVLLSLDRLNGGALMTRMGIFVRNNSYEIHGCTNAEEFTAALIQGLPERSKQIASSLLYSTGEQGLADK
jgi:hypothetical protein